MIRPGARASYQGNLGVVIGAPTFLTSLVTGRRTLWHLVYDLPVTTDLTCGCCPNNQHRYEGVFTTAESLVVVPIL